MAIEIVKNTLQKVVQGFENWRNRPTGSTVLLEWVPQDLRSQIWQADEDKLREVIVSVNQELTNRRLPEIKGHAFKDAIEGNAFLRQVASNLQH